LKFRDEDVGMVAEGVCYDEPNRVLPGKPRIGCEQSAGRLLSGTEQGAGETPNRVPDAS
jgi:hypothetical protein